MADITEAIEDVLSEWDVPTPEAVNRGDCDIFAHEVLQSLGGSSSEVWLMYTRELPEDELMLDTRGSNPEPVHTWLTDGDKHYDAEAPQGVGQWQELPIFRRWGYYGE